MIEGAVLAVGVTAKEVVLLVPQPLIPETVIEPAPEPTSTLIVLVPAPSTIFQPVGKVQLKYVAPVSADTLYSVVTPAQGKLLPMIVGGAVGAEEEAKTFKTLGSLGPQGFTALTVMSPEPEPTVTVIELVPAPAVITQPEGKVQL